MDDGELVRAVVAGESEAFQELMSRYMPLVAGYVRGKTRDRSEAEDVLQEIFLGAFVQLKNLKDAAHIGPWLLKIARHKVADQHRRRFREARLAGPGGESGEPDSELLSRVADTARSPREDVALRELSDAMRDALSRLRDTPRMILYLRLWEGYSAAEIAERLKMKEGAVRVQLHRGLKALRIELRRRGLDVNKGMENEDG